MSRAVRGMLLLTGALVAFGHSPSAPPPLPAMRTCAAGSPAAEMPFCDGSKTHEERARLLAGALTTVRNKNRFSCSAIRMYF